MVKVTNDAAAMISDMVQQRHRPPGAGLRIAQREDHPALAMSLADSAEPEDVIVVRQDAHVFLAPAAQDRLSHETLDARTNEAGSAFFLRP